MSSVADSGLIRDGYYAYGGLSMFSSMPALVFHLPHYHSADSVRLRSWLADLVGEPAANSEDADQTVLQIVRLLRLILEGPYSAAQLGSPRFFVNETHEVGAVFCIEAPPGPAGLAVVASLRSSLTNALMGSPQWPLVPSSELDRWCRELGDWKKMSPLVEEARLLGIPVRLSWQATIPMISLGQGARKRIILGPFHQVDSATAMLAGSNKAIGRAFLEQLNVPVPVGRVVSTLSEAEGAATEIGYPVVLKAPIASNSTAVVADIPDPTILRTGFRHLRRRHPIGGLILEAHLHGHYFRALIIDGRCVRVSGGRPNYVVGDGVSSVEQLVSQDDRGLTAPLQDPESANRLRCLLIGQRLELCGVPLAGTRVRVSPSTANWRDCTTTIHVDNRDTLERIGRSLAPSILGIDIVCDNISSAWIHGRDGVIEVNAGPGTWFHSDQKGLARAMLTRLLSDSGRVPVVCFAGPEGQSLAASATEKHQHGNRVVTGAIPAKNIPGSTAGVDDPVSDVEFVGLDYETALNFGLPFDRCDVLSLTSGVNLRLVERLLTTLRPSGLLIPHPGIQLGPFHDTIRSRGLRLQTS